MANIGIKTYELGEFLEVKVIKKEKKLSFREVEKEKELELKQLEILMKEDFDKSALANISKEKLRTEIIRYQSIINSLKQRYDCKCQICGQTFLMDNGKFYCEAHHIDPISENGSQDPKNVILLCANHHRKFHYAKDRIRIGDPIDGRRAIWIDDVRYDVRVLD